MLVFIKVFEINARLLKLKENTNWIENSLDKGNSHEREG